MDGIIIVNKPKGVTSHDIVHKIKKISIEKVGHTGTLDPMATGVLPLLIGKGTLCSKYLINHDKVYKVKLQLGIKTSTGDLEGQIVENKSVDEELLEEENVKITLKKFIGKQEQVPPIYSAIKVNGQKLYEYARKGQNVEIKPRQIEIYYIKLLKINKIEKQIEFEVICSKGTYIRSLCEDIAIKLGTVGFMSELNRIKVGDFSINEALQLDEIQSKQDIEKNIITIEKQFINYPKVELENKKLQLFLNGVILNRLEKDGIYRIYNQNKFIGIGKIEKNLLKRDIII